MFLFVNCLLVLSNFALKLLVSAGDDLLKKELLYLLDWSLNIFAMQFHQMSWLCNTCLR